MITDRDKRIIKHIEEYKFATISQLEKIFCKTQKYSYNIIRKRMYEIEKHGYIKKYRHSENNRIIYMLNDRMVKPPSYHRLLLLDVLAELLYMGLDVKLFEVEKYWMEGKVRSDGFTVFTLDNENVKNRYHYFIEIHTSNNNYNLEKYDKLYNSGEVQQYLKKNHFPRVLLITDREHEKLDLKHTKVLTIRSTLDGLATALLP